MPQPEGSQLNQGYSTVLTNLAISYLPTFNDAAQNPDGITYIAKQVFPNVPVGAPSGAFNIWKAGDFLRLQMKALANDEAPPEIGFTGTKGNFNVQNYGVSTKWTARDLANARLGGTSEAQFLNMKTLLVTGQGVLNLEQQVSTIIQTAGNWTTTYAGVASAPSAGQFLQWDQPASDPVQDVQTWKRAYKLLTGRNPNTMILPEIVYTKLLNNVNIRATIQYSGTPDQPVRVTINLLQILFDMPRILVPNGVYNSAAEGQAQNLVEFWGKIVWLGFVTPTPSLDAPSAGYSFSWTGDSTAGLPAGVAGGTGPAQFGSVSSPQGLYIRRYNTPRPAAEWIDGELWTTPNVVAPDLGILSTAVIA